MPLSPWVSHEACHPLQCRNLCGLWGFGKMPKMRGSKITADGDCSHKIKRCLLLGWKAMTNLDSLLKSRDITFLSKVHIVKDTVFPIVMHGCESWTIKKAEHQRMDAFWTVVLKKTLENPLDCKEIKPVSPKGNQPWIFTGRTDAKAEASILGQLMQRANSLEKTLMLGKTEAWGDEGDIGWDG